MTYKKTYRFSAAHFSDDAAPTKIFDVVANRDFDGLLECVQSIHGHDFKVVCEISTYDFKPLDQWVIDDVEITKLLSQFQGKNLSLLPKLFNLKLRATTENVCHMILDELCRIAPEGVSISVELFENDDISAFDTWG